MQYIIYTIAFFSLFLTNVQYLDMWATMKWVAILGMAALGCFYIATRQEIRIPTKAPAILLSLLVVTRLLGNIGHFNFATETDLSFALLFITILYMFLQMPMNPKWFLLASGIVGSYYWWANFIYFRILSGVSDPMCYSLFFGNINMLSEYMVLTLPLVAHYHSKEGIGRWERGAWSIVLFTWWVLMLAGWSRSVQIGLILWVLFWLWKKQWKMLAVPLVAVVFLQVIPSANKMDLNYKVAKAGSFDKRLNLYKQSLKMLVGNPTGIGSGQFNYQYIPYQMAGTEAPVEREVYRSPHSDVLKWGIENGIAYMLVALLALYWIFARCWREQSDIFTTFLVVLAPQILFQFPFDNPISMVMIAFMLSRIIPMSYTPNRWWVQAFFWGLGTVTLIHGIVFCSSHFRDLSYPLRYGLENPGCVIYPDNWQACNTQLMEQMKGNRYDMTVPLTLAELERRPFQFTALRVLGVAYYYQAKRPEACEIWLVYKSFFISSMLDDNVRTMCSDIKNPLHFENGKQFDTDYRAWLKIKMENIHGRPSDLDSKTTSPASAIGAKNG